MLRYLALNTECLSVHGFSRCPLPVHKVNQHRGWSLVLQFDRSQ